MSEISIKCPACEKYFSTNQGIMQHLAVSMRTGKGCLSPKIMLTKINKQTNFLMQKRKVSSIMQSLRWLELTIKEMEKIRNVNSKNSDLHYIDLIKKAVRDVLLLMRENEND